MHMGLSKDYVELKVDFTCVWFQVSGYLNLFANVVDNFTHGLAVGGSFLVSKRVSGHQLLSIQVAQNRCSDGSEQKTEDNRRVRCS